MSNTSLNAVSVMLARGSVVNGSRSPGDSTERSSDVYCSCVPREVKKVGLRYLQYSNKLADYQKFLRSHRTSHHDLLEDSYFRPHAESLNIIGGGD